jgi:F-type H+/Na+-transporting ATPase subunit beta
MTTRTIPIGDGLFGRAIDSRGRPVDDRGALQNVRMADAVLGQPSLASAPMLWDTGIKVIDFYAPLAFGSTVVLQATPKAGMAITVKELVHRLAAQQGGCAVFAHLDTERTSLGDKLALIDDTGVERHTVVVTNTGSAASDERRQVCRTALTIAEACVAQGRDVVLAVDDGLVIPTTVGLLQGRARVVGRVSLTILLCFLQRDDQDSALEPGVRPLVDAADTQLTFSHDLAQQAIWPPIDPLASSSRFLHPEYVATEQVRVAEAARRLLRSAARSEPERSRAHKLRLFQAQPLFVAERFTNRPAEYVPRAATVQTFHDILAGAYDSVEDKALQFTGRARSS